MSLRDFNTPASDDPIALHNEPVGNGAGLSTFHTVNPEDREPNNMPKIVGAVAIALMVGVAGVGLYAYSGKSPKPVVADNSLPQSAPVAPPPQQMAADTSMSNTAPVPSAVPPAPMKPTPAATSEAPKPAPIRTASARPARSHAVERASDAMSTRMNADSTQVAQTPQPAQVTPVPEQAQATPLPAAPAPSPSDVASAKPAVPNNAATASDIPPASNVAPAQDQQSGATPPPAPAQ